VTDEAGGGAVVGGRSDAPWPHRKPRTRAATRAGRCRRRSA